MFDIVFLTECKQATEITVEIDTGLPVERSVWVAKLNLGTQAAAYLMKKHLSNSFQGSIERAHRLAYQQGYKDGRGKKRKKTYFRTSFTKDNPAI